MARKDWPSFYHPDEWREIVAALCMKEVSPDLSREEELEKNLAIISEKVDPDVLYHELDSEVEFLLHNRKIMTEDASWGDVQDELAQIRHQAGCLLASLESMSRLVSLILALGHGLGTGAPGALSHLPEGESRMEDLEEWMAAVDHFVVVPRLVTSDENLARWPLVHWAKIDHRDSFLWRLHHYLRALTVATGPVDPSPVAKVLEVGHLKTGRPENREAKALVRICAGIFREVTGEDPRGTTSRKRRKSKEGASGLRVDPFKRFVIAVLKPTGFFKPKGGVSDGSWGPQAVDSLLRGVLKEYEPRKEPYAWSLPEDEDEGEELSRRRPGGVGPGRKVKYVR